MSDTRKRAKLFPVRLEGVYIAKRHEAVIDREIKRRNPNYDPTTKKPSRLRNGVIRDYLDFGDAYDPLFLTWLATRGENAMTGE